MEVNLGPHVRAFDAFSREPIPGAVKADTGTMTITIALPLGGGVVSRRERGCNFTVRVADDAPDEIKRLYPRFVNPLFAPPPETP